LRCKARLDDLIIEARYNIGAKAAERSSRAAHGQTHPMQPDLFGNPPAPPMPDGWRYREDFIDAGEEAALLEAIAAMPLHAARYKSYTARRRIASFGTEYDFDANRLLPGAPIPEVLLPLRARAAAWAGMTADDFSSALVAEYAPGTPLGWHRDVPDFELVFGLSLGSAARMRLRRYPPAAPKQADVLAITLPPRSAYVLSGAARWGWQHAIAPTKALRWSITLRTRRRRGAPAAR
jgi:alkylated DNA repair dioxygenase AlkB